MKNIDNIEDWYRTELNNYNVEPDKNGWNSLSDDLDSSTPLTDETVSDWYKKEVYKLEERPDYTVWEKLATQLDTASVWDKLAVSLNRYDQLLWWRNAAIRGTAVFLLCFGSYLAYENYFDTENNLTFYTSSNSEKENYTNKTPTILDINTKENKNSFSSSNNDSVNALSEKSNITKSNITSTLSSEEQIRAAIKKAKTEATSQSIQSKKNVTTNNNKLYASKKIISHSKSISTVNLENLKTINEKTIFTKINRHQLNTRDISHLLKDGEYLVKKDKDKIVFNSKRFSSYSMFGIYTQRIYAGFNVGLKKQGMITKLKDDSPLVDYKQNDLLDFGASFGGTVGFILSDNINIEANVNINSTAGYKRAFSAEEKSYKENINLNYSTINLLAKKMNTKSTFDNKVYSTNFIGGVYASYLTSAVSNINGTTNDIASFNETDYGIVLGIEQDRYITKTLVLTPGLRYNQGIANTSNSDGPFESSRNFSFEFNLGVKYIFLKKGK